MNNKQQKPGMPSILGDIPAPFSANKPAGVGADFDAAYTQWQTNKNPETNTALLKTIQPVVDTAVMSYAGNNANPSLRSRAKMMALKALETYDPARGNVRTHLLSQLQSIRRAAAQSQNIITIPEQVGLDYGTLSDAEAELQDELSRDPTDDELADRTGLSVRRIQKIRAFHQPLSEGTTQQVTEDGQPGDVASSIPGATSGEDAWFNFVYDDLTPTDKLVADMLLGRHGRRRASTQEIARRLNITPGAVSQRAAKIQAMLDMRKTYGGF